jgi:hypothetical protein
MLYPAELRVRVGAVYQTVENVANAELKALIELTVSRTEPKPYGLRRMIWLWVACIALRLRRFANNSPSNANANPFEPPLTTPASLMRTHLPGLRERLIWNSPGRHLCAVARLCRPVDN